MSNKRIDLPVFENLKLVEKVTKSLFKENKINLPPKNILEIHKAFEIIKKTSDKGDMRSQYIISYLYYNVASYEKRKRKVTARDFEDFIARIFEGGVTDETKRHNNYSLKSELEYDYVAGYVISNLREKSDILFDNYGISVKTSMPNNKEINMGSFAREALFYKILNSYGSERKGGLGSATQMLKTFAKIEEIGKWDIFVKRFKEMVKNIFQDDFLFVIKGGSYIEIYSLSAKKLQRLFYKAINSGSKKATWLINRYEGNSIRIKRDPVLKICKKVTLKFEKLKDSSLLKFKESVYELECNLIDYLIKIKDKDEFNKNSENILGKIKKIVK
jgi:hypothetical protein